ncbi:S8 family serine peptidase [Halapricum sp. CBA1109]|uniref:S8 family serine peptidase n=1 Tax=Halapricum sp. CBA1109 TaxID=2668068 RepID=UPI0012F93939|nr:S8 family serine peptidase [Halapricum sp. CBA1109]MUV88905.1 S8 family serine peptidase [Halapricum sp. CBA1109]
MGTTAAATDQPGGQDVRASAALSSCADVDSWEADAAGGVDSDSGDDVRVVVIYEDNVTRASCTGGSVSAVGGRVLGGESVDIVSMRVARVDPAAIPTLRANPAVRAVERDHVIRIQDGATGNETTDTGGAASQSVPWGVGRINATRAAQSVPAANRANVDVAVVDTGIDYDHPDLEGSVEWGYDTTDEVGTAGVRAADDDNRHGTHVAGTIAASDNDRGVVGVAPGVDLYSMKALNADGYGYYSWWAEALDRAVKGPDGEIGTEDDADVISISAGGDERSTTLRNAVENAAEHSVIVAAAGNDGDGDPTTDEVSYPAAYPEVMGVAATDRDDLTTRTSAEGPDIAIAAPGEDILSTVPIELTGYDYGRLDGTSMAAPHVSGVAALLIASDFADGERTVTDAQIREQLTDTATDIHTEGRDNYSGYGRLRAAQALNVSGGLGSEVVVEATQVDADGFPTVDVYVSVTNGSRPVSGLTAADVEVDENGTDRPVESVTPIGDDDAVDTVFAVSRSGTLDSGTLADATAAVRQYVGNFGPNDEGAVVSFADDVRIDRRWTDNRTALNRSVASLQTGGNTSLYDGALRSVREAATQDVRTAVVLLAGGEGDDDTHTMSDVVDAARAENVPIYAVGLPSGDATVLRNLSRRTGGEYYAVSTASDLSEAYATIGRQIRDEYRVSYDASDTATNGNRRTVEVTARSGGMVGSGIGRYRAPCAPLPTAAFNYSLDRQTVSVDAAPSSPRSDLSAMQWDFDGDGVVDGRGRTANYTYADGGTYEVELRVARECGADDTAVRTVTVPDAPDSAVVVSNGTVRPGSRTELTLSAVADGVAGYRTKLRYDPSVLTVVDAIGGDFATPVVNVDNASGTAVLTQSRASGVDNPTLARVTVAAAPDAEAGTYPVTVDAAATRLRGPTDAIPVGIENGSATVSAADGVTLPDATGPAGDPDSDGLFEDVDGNGRTDLFDALALYNNLDSDPIRTNARAFDFDGSGSVDIFDALALYNEVSE